MTDQQSQSYISRIFLFFGVKRADPPPTDPVENACPDPPDDLVRIGSVEKACRCACRFVSGMTYIFSAACMLIPIWFPALMFLLRYQDGNASEKEWHASLAMFGVVAGIAVIVGVLCGIRAVMVKIMMGHDDF